MQNDKYYKTLNDNPTSNEELIKRFYGNFAKRVINEIKGCDAPKTIAITGGWGSGKTSVLANIYQELTGKSAPFENNTQSEKDESSAEGNSQSGNGKPSYIGVWFEAWRYQHGAQPVIALLHAIKDEFSLLPSLQQSVKKITNVALFGSLAIFDGVAKKLSGGVDPKLSKLPQIAKQYEQDNLLAQLPSNQIHHALEAAVDTVIKEANHPKLLIFIDDLDRCHPSAALKLLEGIKLYLNIPKCVIVMAVDQEQLEQAVKAEFDNTGHHFIGVEYLEKLCQDAHRIPAIPAHISAKFVVEEVKKLLGSRAEMKESTSALTSALDQIKIQLEKFACLPANPRRIKMVINRLVAHLTDWEELSSIEIQDSSKNTASKPVAVDVAQQTEALIFIVCTQVSYRAIFEQIAWDTSFIERIVDVFNDDNFTDESRAQLTGTALEGIYIPSETTPLKGIHPSHLTVFRPVTIIQDEEINIEIFKALLKTLIDRYNGFE